MPLNSNLFRILLILVLFSGSIFSQKTPYNPVESNWVVYNTSNSGLPSNYINTVYIDEEGVIYIGSSGGLTIIEGSVWNNYGPNELGDYNNLVTAIVKDKLTGKLFLGLNSNSGFGGGVLKQTDEGWEHIIIPPNGNDKDVRFLCQPDTYKIWVGYQEVVGSPVGYCYGIDEIAGTQVTNISSQTGIESYIFTSCAKCRNETWVTAETQSTYWGPLIGGAAKYENSNWQSFTIENSGISAQTVYSVQKDKDDNVWFGTIDGLRKFDGENWTVINESNSEIPIERITALTIDSLNNLWFGLSWGSYGLIKYDGNIFTVYNTNNSEIPSDNINYLTVDGSNNLWIATGNGLAIFNENGISAVKDHNRVKNFILKNNYPNPFNPETVIEYKIPESSYVNIEVYNVVGSKIKTLVNEWKRPGNYKLTFSGKNLASGLYLCRMDAGQYHKTIKMLLVK